MTGTMGRVIVYIVIFQIVSFPVWSHPCTESRTTIEVPLETTVDCKDVQLSTIPVFPEETTHLLLKSKNIKVIEPNVFAHLRNLRSLDLWNNDIRHLFNASFHGLSNLRTLNLNRNSLSFIETGVFDELFSLETLLISGRAQNYSILPTLPVTVLTNLRVLSLALNGDAAFPMDYGQLSALEIIDSFHGNIDNIDIAMMDKIRSWNISSLAFRRQGLTSIESGAFSNFSNLRSLNLCCNRGLGFKDAIAAVVQTQNSNIDTLVLDNTHKIGTYNILNLTNFCTPFGSQIRRLSVRDNGIFQINMTNIHCLAELREFDISYNPLTSYSPTMKTNAVLPYVINNLPHICSLSVSVNNNLARNCDNENGPGYYDVESFFSIYAKCLDQVKIDGQRLTPKPHWPSSTHELFPQRTDNDKVKHLYIPPSIQIFHVVHLKHPTNPTVEEHLIFNPDNNIRHINMSYTSTALFLSGSVIGLNQLETLDASHCDLIRIKLQFGHFPNLKNLNISRNRFDTVPVKLCNSSPKLEDFDMSHNQLRKIYPFTFKSCERLKHIKLGGNSLRELYLQLSSLTKLETLSLNDNKLMTLSRQFTAEIDNLFRVKTFTLDIRNNNFVCSCDTLPFIRWIQTTEVHLVAKNELVCVVGKRRMQIVDVSLAELTDECSSILHIIIIGIVVVVFALFAIVAVLVWNKWYIKYRIILCSLSVRRNQRTESSEHYDATVLYFAYPTKEEDYAANKEITRWVVSRLLPVAEQEEGLRLFIDDRDGIAIPKADLFISSFENSDKLIVCITPELLADEFCMNNIQLALASKKPLCQFMFINFCGDNYPIPSRQLRHLMRPKSGATYLEWNENEADHSDFWRRLRGALNRGSAGNGCNRFLGLLADASASEMEQMNPQ